MSCILVETVNYGSNIVRKIWSLFRYVVTKWQSLAKYQSKTDICCRDFCRDIEKHSFYQIIYKRVETNEIHYNRNVLDVWQQKSEDNQKY